MTRHDDDNKTRKQRSIAQARDGLANLVHEVEGGAPVELTRRGKPVAVLVSFADYQRLLGEGPSFWDAMLAFRSATQHDDETLGIEPDLFARDKSPGRNVDLS
jgi:prevent-host-death family protein